MFVGGLTFGGERFQVGAKRVPDAASHCARGDFRWSGFTPAQRFFQSRDGNIDPYGTPMAEVISDGLRHAEDGDRDTFDVVCLDPVAETLIGKVDCAQRWIVGLRFPLLRTDGGPYPSRHLVRDAVEGEGRDEADDALGHPLGGLGKAMIAVGGRVRELIESAAEPGDEALPFQPGCLPSGM
jgi:hypothetical protein